MQQHPRLSMRTNTPNIANEQAVQLGHLSADHCTRCTAHKPHLNDASFCVLKILGLKRRRPRRIPQEELTCSLEGDGCLITPAP